MFDNLRLGTKLMLAMGLAILAVTAVLGVASLHSLEEVIDQAERAELDGNVKAVADSIAMESRLAEGMATLVAALPPVQIMFATDDRDGLSALLLPAYKATAERFAVDQFQFHTPPATSFLRLHKPDKFGDDLSSFRQTVVRTNRTATPTRGLEGGVAGLGVRGVVPIVANAKHAGSVEFGMNFGQDFFTLFKERRNVDIALHIPEGDRFTTYASTLGKAPILSPAALTKAYKGDSQIERVDVQGIPRTVYATAIEDFSGKRIGVLEVAMDRSRYVATLSRGYVTVGLVGLGALALGLILAALTSRHVTRRLYRLVAGVREVAKGDLTTDIQAEGLDEVGVLGEAAAQMRAQLHALAVEVRANAQAVHEAAREIAGAVEGQAATSSEMSASVAEITSTMEELSASSTQIAEYSKSVVDIANQSWEQSKRGSDAMELVLGKMADIQGDNQNSLREILDLGRRSKEISKVMEIINAVADQTKLIAFNAALEAASAGDAGRRFSVVAAEIRRLADSVTDSTGEIEAKISEIQESINRLVITSEKGAGSIAAGMEATTHTADRLGDMVEAAHQTTNAAQQISLSTQQQKTASNQVVVALREIVTASSHTSQSIARISAIAKDMAALSAKLDTLVGRFRLHNGAQAPGSAEPEAQPATRVATV